MDNNELAMGKLFDLTITTTLTITKDKRLIRLIAIYSQRKWNIIVFEDRLCLDWISDYLNQCYSNCGPRPDTKPRLFANRAAD